MTPVDKEVSQPPRFTRYYFPLEGTRSERGFFSVKPGNDKAPTDALPAPSVVGESPTTAPLFLSDTGTPDIRTFLGHYDVTTTWDIDNPAVDTTTYSPQVGFTRMQYSTLPYGDRKDNLLKASQVVNQLEGAEGWSVPNNRDPKRPLPEDEFTVGGKVFNKYASIKVSDSLEIKDICRWAAKIHPRDVTDLKPMFILMQGLLRDLLDDKFKFYSEENDLLRAQMRDLEQHYQDELRQLEEEIEALREEMDRERNDTKIQSMFQGALTKMKSIAKTTKNETEREAIVSTLKERERAEEALKKNLKDARMELDRLMSSNQGMLIGMRRLEDDKTELAGKCTRLESELRMFQNDCEELVKLCQHQQEQLLHKQTFMQWAFKDRDLDKKFGDMLEGVTTKEEMAAWMVNRGPVAAGLALEAFANGAAPHLETLLASAFNMLDPQYAKEVLKTTSVAAAGKVMAHVGDASGAKMAKLLAEIPMWRAGAILGELEENAFESFMKTLSMMGDRKVNAMTRARENYKQAKKALRVAAASTEHQSAEPELNLSLQTAKSLKYPMHDREEIGGGSRPNTAKSAKSAKSGMEDPLSLENAADALDDVQQALADAQDALQKIDPKVAAELLSGAASDVSAALLERLPSSLAPRIVDMMAQNARMVGKAREDNVMDEIKAAIERIRTATDTEEMNNLTQIACEIIQDKMAMSLTVCAVDLEEQELEREAAAEAARGGKGASDPSLLEDAEGGEPVGPDLDDATAPDLMPGMEVVATCELDPAGRYGAPLAEASGVDDGGKRGSSPARRGASPGRAGSSVGQPPKAEASTLSSAGETSEVQPSSDLDYKLLSLIAVKNSQGLATAQKYALDNSILTVMHQHVVCPIFIPLKDKVTPYGTISSSSCPPHQQGNCPYCGKFRVGGESSMNAAKTPEGTEVIRLMAAAISETAARLVVEEGEEMAKLEQLMETASGIITLQTSDIKEMKKVKKLAEIYAGRISRKMRSSTFLRKQLAEIKRYPKPPGKVIRIITAMLCILDQPKIKDHLLKEYGLPEDKNLPKLWGWERTQLIVDRSNPLSLPHRMAAEIRKETDHVAAEGKIRFRAARVMMDGVTHQDAVKASSAVQFLRKWTLAMLNAQGVAQKMKEFGYS